MSLGNEGEKKREPLPPTRIAWDNDSLIGGDAPGSDQGTGNQSQWRVKPTWVLLVFAVAALVLINMKNANRISDPPAVSSTAERVDQPLDLDAPRDQAPAMFRQPSNLKGLDSLRVYVIVRDPLSDKLPESKYFEYVFEGLKSNVRGVFFIPGFSDRPVPDRVRSLVAVVAADAAGPTESVQVEFFVTAPPTRAQCDSGQCGDSEHLFWAVGYEARRSSASWENEVFLATDQFISEFREDFFRANPDRVPGMARDDSARREEVRRPSYIPGEMFEIDPGTWYTLPGGLTVADSMEYMYVRRLSSPNGEHIRFSINGIDQYTSQEAEFLWNNWLGRYHVIFYALSSNHLASGADSVVVKSFYPIAKSSGEVKFDLKMRIFPRDGSRPFDVRRIVIAREPFAETLCELYK